MIVRAKTFIAKLWHAAPVATVVLFLALAAAVVFGVRTAIFWYRHPDWDIQTQGVEPWMTPRYVARAWDLPFRDLLQAIEAPVPPPDGPMSLEELADYRGVPLSQILAEVQAVIQETHPDLATRTGGTHD